MEVNGLDVIVSVASPFVSFVRSTAPENWKLLSCGNVRQTRIRETAVVQRRKYYYDDK